MDVSAATTEIVELGSGSLYSVYQNYKFFIGANGSYVYAFENNDVGVPNYESMLANYATGTVQYSFDTGILSEGTVHNYDALYCDGGYVRLTPRVDYTLTHSGDSFDSFISSVVSIRPYLILNGEKRYLSPWVENQVFYNYSVDSGVYFYLGFDVDLIVSYDDVAYTLEDVKTYFGTLTLNIECDSTSVDLVGYKYISTGDEAVTDSVGGLKEVLQDLLGKSNTKFDSLLGKFNISLTSLRDSINNTLKGMRDSVLDDLDVWQDDQSMQDNLSNQLQQDQNDLVGTGNELQEENNALQEEANETSKNIFDKIADFFGSFFGNFIDALKGLFVPDEGYFEDFFDRMSDFFSEKLGALYAPIDIFLRVLDAFSDVDAVDPGIRFPGYAWQGTYIIEPQTIKLSEYIAVIPGLQDMIYLITNTIMVGAVLWLLQVKLREVLKN